MKNLGDLMQVCTEAWIHCENLLSVLSYKQHSFSKRTVQVIDECAQLCLGTTYAFKHQLTNQNNIALLCLGLCEECAEVCERYNDAVFKQCATACRQCSALISTVAKAAL